MLLHHVLEDEAEHAIGTAQGMLFQLFRLLIGRHLFVFFF